MKLSVRIADGVCDFRLQPENATGVFGNPTLYGLGGGFLITCGTILTAFVPPLDNRSNFIKNLAALVAFTSALSDILKAALEAKKR